MSDPIRRWMRISYKLGVLLMFMIKVKKMFFSRAKEIFLSGAFSLREAT